MSPIRVHFLVCETRPSVLWSYNQSITPLVHGGSTGILVVNLCANSTWGAWDRGGAMKHARVSAYIRSGAAAPDDLLLFSDSDVIINAVENATGLLRRFDEAQVGKPRIRIIFMAEPFCWAPWAKTWPTGRVCSPQVVAQYQRQFLNTSMPARCPRYLNAGSYAGRARDVDLLVKQWLAGMAVLTGGTVGATWPGPPPVCYRGDQCVATNLLLNSNGFIGLDIHERLFASGTVAALPGSAVWRGADRGGGAIRCGDTRCRAGTRLHAAWQLVGTDRGTSAAWGGHFERREEYRVACATIGAPVLIHFQGVAKAILMSHDVRDWLKRRAAGDHRHLTAGHQNGRC